MVRLAAVGLIFSALYLVSLTNFLLFHTLVELFSVVIAFSIFILAWNARTYLDNPAILFLGIAYLFVGLIDLLHTIAFKGMYIFPTAEANLATQLWLAARYLQAGALLIAPFFLRRRVHPRMMALSTGAVTAVLLASIFFWKNFPGAYLEPRGLTSFKIYSEYAISSILIAALLIWLWKGSAFDPKVARFFYRVYRADHFVRVNVHRVRRCHRHAHRHWPHAQDRRFLPDLQSGG